MLLCNTNPPFSAWHCRPQMSVDLAISRMIGDERGFLCPLGLSLLEHTAEITFCQALIEVVSRPGSWDLPSSRIRGHSARLTRTKICRGRWGFGAVTLPMQPSLGGVHPSPLVYRAEFLVRLFFALAVTRARHKLYDSGMPPTRATLDTASDTRACHT
jgi:hypothetical protein